MEWPGHSCPFANERVLAAVSSFQAGLHTALSFFIWGAHLVPSRAGAGLTFISSDVFAGGPPWLQAPVYHHLDVLALEHKHTELGLFDVHQTNKREIPLEERRFRDHLAMSKARFSLQLETS